MTVHYILLPVRHTCQGHNTTVLQVNVLSAAVSLYPLGSLWGWLQLFSHSFAIATAAVHMLMAARAVLKYQQQVKVLAVKIKVCLSL